MSILLLRPEVTFLWELDLYIKSLFWFILFFSGLGALFVYCFIWPIVENPVNGTGHLLKKTKKYMDETTAAIMDSCYYSIEGTLYGPKLILL